MVAFSSSTVSTISSLVIINAICDKIGIVYDKAVGLVPYIVRYNITHDVIMLIIGLAFILTGALLWRKGDKLMREDMKQVDSSNWGYYADNHLGWFICGGGALTIGAILALIHVADLTDCANAGVHCSVCHKTEEARIC